MNIVAQFDPSALQGSSFNAGFNTGTGKIVVYNESNINISLSWAGFQSYCPAWTAMLYCINAPSANIVWAQMSTLPAIGGPPISTVIVESYNSSEPILGTFPAPLFRQTSIGNAVSTTTGVVASSIQNDTSPAGTNIIESTVSGDGLTSVQLTNDAQMTLGSSVRAGKLTVKGSGSQVQGDGTNNLILESGGAARAVEFNVNVLQKAYIDSIGLALSSGTIRGAAQDLVLDTDTTGKAVRLKSNGIEQAAFGLAGSVLNGSTSGTATIWQALRGGSLKSLVLQLSNFRNGNAGSQTLALPATFTVGFFFYAGNVSPFQCLNGGVAQNVGIITTLNAAGGSPTIQTTINKYSFGDNTNPFDTISFVGSQASAFSGIAIFIGS